MRDEEVRIMLFSEEGMKVSASKLLLTNTKTNRVFNGAIQQTLNISSLSIWRYFEEETFVPSIFEGTMHVIIQEVGLVDGDF
jgi:hypothetical protein